MFANYFKVTPEVKDVGQLARFFREDEDFELLSVREDHLVVRTGLAQEDLDRVIRVTLQYWGYLVTERLTDKEEL